MMGKKQEVCHPERRWVSPSRMAEPEIFTPAEALGKGNTNLGNLSLTNHCLARIIDRTDSFRERPIRYKRLGWIVPSCKTHFDRSSIGHKTSSPLDIAKEDHGCK